MLELIEKPIDKDTVKDKKKHITLEEVPVGTMTTALCGIKEILEGRISQPIDKYCLECAIRFKSINPNYKV